jgi:SAM-dependent methyltransferase
MQNAGILPTYNHLFRRWLKLLAGEGLVRLDPAADTFAMDAPAAPQQLDELLAEARRHFRTEQFIVDYVERCGSMLPDVLTGRVPALETLFPDGEADLAEKMYTEFSVSRYVSGIASAAVAAKVASHVRRVRVLEIGAGTGGTTAAVLPALPGGRTSYCFTDISDYFLTQAAARFQEFDFVDYRILDLGSGLEEQGFAEHQFDVVIATNVLHAVPDLRRALANVLKLLSGDGVLVLCEVTRELDWYDISTGLIEGWQSFADDLRKDSPILAAAQWNAALLDAGFTQIVTLPEAGTAAEAVGQSVLLALAPAGKTAAVPADSVQQAVAPLSGEKGESAFRARLLEVPDNERFDLLVEHVLHLVAAILRLPADDFPDARAGLFDLGLDSLMALDFRRRLAASLGLDAKLPATLIFDHPNADSIARYLEQQWLKVPAESPAITAQTPATVAGRKTLSDRELAELSDVEVEALLMQRLESGRTR